MFLNFAKMFFAGFVTFIIGCFICIYYNKLEMPRYFFEISKIIIVIISCSGIYAGLNIILGMDYAKDLISRLKKN